MDAMTTPNKFESDMAILAIAKAKLVEVASLLADLTRPHNYCFTVSDDEVCDRGYGECRAFTRDVWAADGSVRQAIGSIKASELAVASMAMEEAKREAGQL